jgi:hypothetical protein
MSYKDQCKLCSEKFRNGRAYVLNNSEELFDKVQEIHETLHSRPLVGTVIVCDRCRTRLSKRLLQANNTNCVSPALPECRIHGCGDQVRQRNTNFSGATF